MNEEEYTRMILAAANRLINSFGEETDKSTLVFAEIIHSYYGVDAEIRFLKRMSKHYEKKQLDLLKEQPDDKATLAFLAAREAVVLNLLQKANVKKAISQN